MAQKSTVLTKTIDVDIDIEIEDVLDFIDVCKNQDEIDEIVSSIKTSHLDDELFDLLSKVKTLDQQILLRDFSRVRKTAVAEKAKTTAPTPPIFAALSINELIV